MKQKKFSKFLLVLVKIFKLCSFLFKMIGAQIQEARIRKIGVLSVANIFGIINAIIGLLIGIIFVLFASLFPVEVSLFGLSFGYFSIITFPIIYGILGFIGGAIGAFLYNLAAKITKGIKLYSD